MDDTKKGGYTYSLDLMIHYCDEENKKSTHYLNNYNIGRKTYDECINIINALGIKEYYFTKRPKKPNYRQQKYGKYDLGYVDVCILHVYKSEKKTGNQLKTIDGA